MADATTPATPAATPTPLGVFSTDEILWYGGLDSQNKWGNAGYAIYNPAGKTTTSNSVIWHVQDLIGRNMFDLMHRQDIRFSGYPSKQWLFDFHQMIISGRTQLTNRTRAANDGTGLDVRKAAPNIREFTGYPIPYFLPDRVRQSDIAEWAGIILLMQSDIAQHSDNERPAWVTPDFSGMAGKYLQEALALMAMKYFGKSRAVAYDPTFTLAITDFANYDPTSALTSVEITQDRPPVQWWPTVDDLTQIKGKPISELLLLSTRWTGGPLAGATGAQVSTTQSGTISAAANPGFVTPPGTSP